jgi:hypothetical protein
MPKIGRNDPCPCGSKLKYKRCHGNGKGPVLPDPNKYHLEALPSSRTIWAVPKQSGIQFKQVGKARLIIPKAQTELRIRAAAEAALRKTCAPGSYKGPEANRVVQTDFGFYQSLCDSAIELIGSRSVLEVLLEQHDQWREVSRLDPKTLGPNDGYLKRAAAQLRALRFAAERTLEKGFVRHDPAEDEKSFQAVEELLIAAEVMTMLGMASDTAHYLFPDDYTVTVNEPGSEKVFTTFHGRHEKAVQEFVGDRISETNRVGINLTLSGPPG